MSDMVRGQRVAYFGGMIDWLGGRARLLTSYARR